MSHSVQLLQHRAHSGSPVVTRHKPSCCPLLPCHWGASSSSLAELFFNVLTRTSLRSWMVKTTVSWTHSICSYLWTQQNQMLLYAAVELPVTLMRNTFSNHHCQLYTEPHGRTLNLSVYNLTRKNELRVDVQVNLEGFLLCSPTPKMNFFLLIYLQWC